MENRALRSSLFSKECCHDFHFHDSDCNFGADVAGSAAHVGPQPKLGLRPERRIESVGGRFGRLAAYGPNLAVARFIANSDNEGGASDERYLLRVGAVVWENSNKRVGK
jgi:hypothetical protein